MKTFVSFSSRDRGFVSKLLSRLKAQPLRVWDYSTEGQEIPGAASIGAYLTERVSQCELFIPVVSSASLESAYTRLEVEAALRQRQRKAQPRIIPLVEVGAAERAEWDEPYDALRGIRYYVVDFGDRSQWERAVGRICRDLDLAYLPLMIEDARLPFMQRFDTEVRDKIPRDSERYNALYYRLEETRNAFCVAFAEGDVEKAAQAIHYFNGICEYEYPDYRFYYPRAAEAVTRIAQGRLTEALDIAFALMDHDLADETAYGIVGYVKQAQGSYQEAADYYREALNRDPTDPAAASGLLANETLCGRRHGLDEVIAVLENGVYYTAADRDRAEAIRAFALANQGRSRAAAEIFRELVRKGVADEQVFISFARTLVDQGAFDEAGRVLEAGSGCFPESLDLWQWAMDFHLQVGSLPLALEAAENAVRLYPERLEQRYYLLFCLYLSHQDQRARSLATEILGSFLPTDRDEFYYSGFANWVLGKEDLARYDFERSGRGAEEYYGRIDR